uniref:CASP8 and FADD like apoptosis regulator n=1 Tax=Fundulus heteroclitus TaxID=8078 RepID=A0A3Q2P6J7_FUNHE
MSPSRERHLRAISAVAEDLSGAERRKVIYLCGSLVTDGSVDRVRDTLRSKADEDGDPSLFVISVLSQLGRYDLLKREFKVGRNEIKPHIHTYGQVLPRFRVLMVTISDDLSMADVEQIKFILSKTLSRDKMGNFKTFLDVVIELEKLDLVSPERVEMVEDCLSNIGRCDLLKKVTAYKMSAQNSGQRLPQQQSSQAWGFSQMPSWHTAATSERRSPQRQSCQASDQLEQYNFKAKPRGVCVIIDCVGKDGGMLEEVFEALHFRVLRHSMLGADEILTTLRDISKERESHKGDAFVCCIISRGTANFLLGTDSGGGGLYLDKVKALFLADACPVLAGKPKLFFIQGYSVPTERENLGELETDGGQQRNNAITKDADVFWSQSWTDGRQLQQEQHHSVYLKALTDALRKTKRKMHLLDVQTVVNNAIHDHNEKNPEAHYHCDVSHTLRKHLYLQ